MRIVLADDHRIVRSGLKWVLDNEPHLEVVGEASDGAELLEVLKTVEADLVLLDLRMPGMSGLDVLPLLQERHASVRVIILSMHDEPAFIRAAIERGASGYLLKSAGMDELLQAIEAVDSGKSYIQSSLTSQLLVEATRPAPPAPSDRGLAALRLVTEGLSNAEIARQLDISEAALKGVLQQTFDRLGVSTRSEAVALALRQGLIE